MDGGQIGGRFLDLAFLLVRLFVGRGSLGNLDFVAFVAVKSVKVVGTTKMSERVLLSKESVFCFCCNLPVGGFHFFFDAFPHLVGFFVCDAMSSHDALKQHLLASRKWFRHVVG